MVHTSSMAGGRTASVRPTPKAQRPKYPNLQISTGTPPGSWNPRYPMNRKIRGVDARRKAHGPKEQITRIERLSFFLESVLYRDPGLAERERHQLAQRILVVHCVSPNHPWSIMYPAPNGRRIGVEQSYLSSWNIVHNILQKSRQPPLKYHNHT